VQNFYNLSQVALLLGKSRPTIERWLKKKLIKGTKMQKVWLIPKSEIERLQRGE